MVTTPSNEKYYRTREYWRALNKALYRIIKENITCYTVEIYARMENEKFNGSPFLDLDIGCALKFLSGEKPGAMFTPLTSSSKEGLKFYYSRYEKPDKVDIIIDQKISLHKEIEEKRSEYRDAYSPCDDVLPWIIQECILNIRRDEGHPPE